MPAHVRALAKPQKDNILPVMNYTSYIRSSCILCVIINASMNYASCESHMMGSYLGCTLACSNSLCINISVRMTAHIKPKSLQTVAITYVRVLEYIFLLSESKLLSCFPLKSFHPSFVSGFVDNSVIVLGITHMRFREICMYTLQICECRCYILSNIHEMFSSMHEMFWSMHEMFWSMHEMFSSMREMFWSMHQMFSSMHEMFCKLCVSHLSKSFMCVCIC
jgi:hypothetical protein